MKKMIIKFLIILRYALRYQRFLNEKVYFSYLQEGFDEKTLACMLYNARILGYILLESIIKDIEKLLY